MRVSAPRRTAWSTASRTIWKSPVWACSPSSSPCATSSATSICRRAGDAPTECLDGRREPELAQRARLEVLAQRAQVLARLAGEMEPARQELRRALPVTLANGLERGVDDLRDRGEVLNRSVVDQLGEPPALLLLGEDSLGEKCTFVVGIPISVNRSSPREARWRPPACACRPRASRGCGGRGSSRSPG